MPESFVKQQSQSPTDGQVEAHLSDALLLSYLHSTDEAESECLAAQLISEFARPIIRSVINYRLPLAFSQTAIAHSHEDAEDISSEVVLEVLTRLRKLKTNPNGLAINSFRSYVAAITYRACCEDLRRKKPHRASLKNRLRYVLTRCPTLALWKSNNREWVCGLSAWENRKSSLRSVRLQQLLDDPHLVEQAAVSSQDVARMNPPDLLAVIFNWVDSPVRFDDLISIVARLWGIKDQVGTTDSYPVEHSTTHDRLLYSQGDIASEVDQRNYLQRIWAEIGQLPQRQRSALLLNLKDTVGEGVIALLPVIGIATFHEIAEALGMSADQLADLWNNLPLDDAAIASLLNVTRQQIINLRKSARERLARRMKALGRKA